MSGCSHSHEIQATIGTANERPEILKTAPDEKVIELDVRPIAAGGSKPCGAINDAIMQLNDGEILHIINSFQPGSLYQRLERQGYSHWTEREGDDWHVWFYKSQANSIEVIATKIQKHQI
jgi:uncharacterized protein (DUF2249 family)